MNAQKPRRKPMRLSDFDYSTPGAYFVTVCTHDAAELFSRIYRLSAFEAPVVELTSCGMIIERNILEISMRFPDYSVECYAIMPNHIHILLTVAEPVIPAEPKTVSDVMGAFKSLTAVQCLKELGIKKLWQRSFYDHIVRDDRDFREIAEYIECNAEKWLLTHPS